MQIDAQLAFVPIAAPLSLVAGAGVAIRSAVIDLFGFGVGVAPNSIWGTPTVIGAPGAMGVGKERVELIVGIGIQPVTATSATLNGQLQAAADTGASGNYQPSTWHTLAESGAIAPTDLTANTVIMRFPWLPPFPAGLRPRYLSLNFVVPSGDYFTAGSIAYAGVTLGRDDQFNKFNARNYTV